MSAGHILEIQLIVMASINYTYIRGRFEATSVRER